MHYFILKSLPEDYLYRKTNHFTQPIKLALFKDQSYFEEELQE